VVSLAKTVVKYQKIISGFLLPKLSDFSLFITSKILDSCFRRNDDYHPMNENVIPVKLVLAKAGNGNPEGFIFNNNIKNRSIYVKTKFQFCEEEG